MRLSIKKRIISILLVFVMILPYAIIATGTTTTNELNNAKDAKSAIERKKEETNNKLAQWESEKKDALSYVNELNKQIYEVNLKIYELNQQIDEKKVKITENEALLEQAKLDSAEQYLSMKLRIQYMYEHGSESYISTLFAAEDMGDMLNKAEYINKITEYDREMLVKYVETETLITQTKITLENEYAELQNSMNLVEAEKSAIVLVQNAKNKELASINSKTETAKAYQQQLDNESKQQEDAISAIEAKIAKEANNSIKYNGGKFTWPVPASKTITSGFAQRINPVTGKKEIHAGIDVAPVAYRVEGDKIVSAYNGQVVFAEYNGTAGYEILINHGDGLFTRYLHLLRIDVSVGQQVTAGQQIALMGGNPSATSGNSTGAHLHFGVRLNGTYVNPMNYFK